MQILFWDEGYYSANAAEILENGNIWVLYMDGKPEHFTAKPPFGIWLKALSFKMFGFNEWATRLPYLMYSYTT